ncbi:hypothetical protein [Agromyces larvae]|uniref:Type IV toxin-antitoxin system AbiEi family antitoxin domain-containing protein n=1 Tax=Agromyces larvae TaxID=2929802 RepID=A0ABY4BWV3_9MICO|nr:hypothetical protein [Agromyces larvae]UOE43389.1 hypothetical protein MTO99_14525 [Agromyces larvae]
MTFPEPEPLIRAADLRSIGADLRSEPPGTLHRLRRGVYVATQAWEQAKREQRHRMMLTAVAATRQVEPVYSHVSAAVIWGIPVVGPHLDRVHLHTAGRSVARTKNGIVWHHDALGSDDVIEIGGMLVTSYERTLVDLARTLPFASAVAAIDHGIRPRRSPDGLGVIVVHQERLLEAVAELGRARGVRPARASIGFADLRSGSPGESISRANMHLLRFPAPDLQVAFPRDGGGKDVTDFDWPDHGAFGEFDGFGKYIKAEFTDGRSIAEIVAEEKARENRIRKRRPFGARWDWPIAMRPELLRRELMDAGLRPIA